MDCNNSEFSGIQPTLQGGSLSQPISVESGRDLASHFSNIGTAGEKVELFFALAENNPEVAVPAFAEILGTKAFPPIRALALQGLRRITQPQIKRALAEDIEVLRDVAKEVKGKGEVSSDLTRWAAAWAIEALGFPLDAIEHLEGGALTDPPYRIRNEIINRKLQEINKIQRFDSRGELTAEYERHLDFWLYGPTEELFRENSISRNYEDVVGDVIYHLHVRGVQLGVARQNRRSIQETALRIAEQIFKKSTELEQRRLYESLEPFLGNDYNQDIPLRRLAAIAICHADSWLPPSARARALIICERWQQVEAMGEPAVSHLEEVIERKLLLSLNENNIINQQVTAVQTIYRIQVADFIQFADFFQKLRVITKVMLRPEDNVRNAATFLLDQHKSILSQDAAYLLKALLFEYRLDKIEPIDLTISEINELISSLNQYHSFISKIFSTAIDAAGSLANIYQKSASSVTQFMECSRNRYLLDLEEWINELREKTAEIEKEQIKIKNNQSILKDALSEIYKVDSELYSKVSSIPNQAILDSREYQTDNQCQKLLSELQSIKSQLVVVIKERSCFIKSEKQGLYQAFLLPLDSIIGIINIFPKDDNSGCSGCLVIFIILGIIYASIWIFNNPGYLYGFTLIIIIIGILVWCLNKKESNINKIQENICKNWNTNDDSKKSTML